MNQPEENVVQWVFQSLMFDLTALNRFDDVRAYTEREHREWLAAAEFEDFARDDLPDTQCVITALKALERFSQPVSRELPVSIFTRAWK